MYTYIYGVVVICMVMLLAMFFLVLFRGSKGVSVIGVQGLGFEGRGALMF